MLKTTVKVRSRSDERKWAALPEPVNEHIKENADCEQRSGFNSFNVDARLDFKTAKSTESCTLFNASMPSYNLHRHQMSRGKMVKIL